MHMKPVNEIVPVEQVDVGNWIIYDNRVHAVQKMVWNRACLWYEVKLSGLREEVNIYQDHAVVRVSVAVDMVSL